MQNRSATDPHDNRGDRATDAIPEEGRLTVESITQALRAARELLGMQIAWVAEFREDTTVYQLVEGDQDAFGFARGAEGPLDGTYCARLIKGEIPQAIPDTSALPAVRDMEVTRRLGMRAYVGVPIELGDGTVYGTLCCASQEATGQMSEHDLNFLRRISRRIAGQIDELRTEWAGAEADAR